MISGPQRCVCVCACVGLVKLGPQNIHHPLCISITHTSLANPCFCVLLCQCVGPECVCDGMCFSHTLTDTSHVNPKILPSANWWQHFLWEGGNVNWCVTVPHSTSAGKKNPLFTGVQHENNYFLACFICCSYCQYQISTSGYNIFFSSVYFIGTFSPFSQRLNSSWKLLLIHFFHSDFVSIFHKFISSFIMPNQLNLLLSHFITLSFPFCYRYCIYISISRSPNDFEQRSKFVIWISLFASLQAAQVIQKNSTKLIQPLTAFSLTDSPTFSIFTLFRVKIEHIGTYLLFCPFSITPSFSFYLSQSSHHHLHGSPVHISHYV